MRPVVGTAVLLLVLMFMSATAAWDPNKVCEAKYPPVPCKQRINNEDWFQMGPNRCVKAFNKPHLNFDDAEKACNKYRHGDFQGHLVSIHDEVELHHIMCTMYRFFTEKRYFWIGLIRTPTEGFASGMFVWTDGTGYNFSRWAKGNPDNFMLREYCVEMKYWDWTRWNDQKCSEQRSYMCAVRIA